MDFFRKLFPLIPKKITAENRDITKTKQNNPLKSDTNSLEHIGVLHLNGKYDSCKNSSGLHGHFEDKRSPNKTLSTLVNVDPIKIAINNDSSKEIVLFDEVSKDGLMLNNPYSYNNIDTAEKPVQSPETCRFNINIDSVSTSDGNDYDINIVTCVKNEKVANNAGISNNVTYNNEEDMMKMVTKHRGHNILNNIILTTIKPNSVSADVCSKIENVSDLTEESTFKDEIDDKTLQNLKEFEATLQSFDRTALTINNSEEIINLDDFNDIFDELDKETKEINYQNTFERFVSEHNTKRATYLKDTSVNIPLQENFDVISINSSVEDNINDVEAIIIHSDEETQESDNDGYHSSDFEFISETEAHEDGFIINFNRENCQRKDNQCSPNSVRSNLSKCEKLPNEETRIHKNSDPGEGPSGVNKSKSQFEDRSYRNNHRIPEGDEYLGMFQGIYNPIMPHCQILFMENKSVRASAMNIQYDGIGFDKQLALRRHPPDSSEEEFDDEAKDCAQKILFMYPGENKKRRRRY